MSNQTLQVFTIGHSDQGLDAFLRLLSNNGIDVLVDVRTYPVSQYAPQFNREQLKKALESKGIRYLYLGKELGGKPEAPEFHDKGGLVLYDRIAVSPPFLAGLERLKRGVAKHRVALMCSEENPSVCHRERLIGRVLGSQGVAVYHIRGDGTVESKEQLTRQEQAVAEGHQLAMLSLQKEEPWRSAKRIRLDSRNGTRKISSRPSNGQVSNDS
ncbi:MAG: DUF488 domain-containing protein [Chloroflexota bacterium]|nr:DUF488 domain-containing protein [Chloroflexota bacterium]